MCVQRRGLYRATELALVAVVSAALLAGCSHPPPADSQTPAAAPPPQTGARPADTAGSNQPPAASDAHPAPLAEAERAKLIELIRRRAEAESRDRAAQPARTPAPAPTGGTTIKSSEQSRGLLAAAGPGAATTDTTAAKPTPPPPSVAAQAPQGTQTPVTPAGQSPTAAKSGGCGDAAATTELVPPPEGSPQPKVACKEPSVKLDSVWKGRPAVFHFEIANNGEAPLQIRLKGGWGLKISGQLDRTIQPGQTEPIEITMQTARPGPLNRKVPVQTNDRTTPQLMLDCNANVLAAVKVEPINVAFGAIDRTAGPQSRTLTLTRGDGGPIAPRVVSTGNARVTAEITEITPGEQYALVVTAGPPWPNGPLSAAIQLDTGVPEGPRETISVFGSVPPRLTALPNQFAFTGALETDTEASVRLRWTGGPPGHIVEASTNIKDASVTFTPGGESADPVVTLKVPAGCAPDLRTGYFVTVKTDDAEAPLLQVPVLFRRVGAPQPGVPVERAPGTKPLRPPGTAAAGNPVSAGPSNP